MITNDELTKLVVAYQKNKLNDKLMLAALYKIAEKAASLKPQFNKLNENNKKEVLNEACKMVLVKLSRFDPSRGKAFNFITTVVLCYIAQVCRVMRRSQPKEG